MYLPKMISLKCNVIFTDVLIKQVHTNFNRYQHMLLIRYYFFLVVDSPVSYSTMSVKAVVSYCEVTAVSAH